MYFIKPVLGVTKSSNFNTQGTCDDKNARNVAQHQHRCSRKANQVKQCETGFPEFSFTAKSF